jgi:hypothetical protein
VYITTLKIVPIYPHFHQDNSDTPTKVDDETDNWPVPDQFQEQLSQIKRTHCVQPLRAYMDNRFIEPNDVNGTLANALVEIHFTIKHYNIRREGEKPFDSFTANIEQLTVLERGAPKQLTPYKRRNPRSGPLKVKCVKVSMIPTQPSTSASKGICSTSTP